MGDNEIKLSRKEKAAINRLRKLAEYWPDSLWLFCDGNAINVMKCGENGERVYEYRGGGVDRNYVVANIYIHNDGGTW